MSTEEATPKPFLPFRMLEKESPAQIVEPLVIEESQDLQQLQATVKSLKETRQKNQAIIQEMLVELTELETLEKETLELLLKKLRQQ